jgi:uncharacterized OB-fold protein
MRAKYLVRELDDVACEFYRLLGEDRRLATTRCERCGVTSFPPRGRCPRCGELPSWVDLPRDGVLYAFTTQETALRFAAPAVLAIAQLGDVSVPGIVRAPYSELRIRERVSVQLVPDADTGLTLLEFVSGRSA